MSEVVNIIFGKLAEDVLQAALAASGYSQDVVVFPDDLSCGPLNPLGACRFHLHISSRCCWEWPMPDGNRRNGSLRGPQSKRMTTIFFAST